MCKDLFPLLTKNESLCARVLMLCVTQISLYQYHSNKKNYSLENIYSNQMSCSNYFSGGYNSPHQQKMCCLHVFPPEKCLRDTLVCVVP